MTPLASKMLRAALRAVRRSRADCVAVAEMLDSVLEIEGEEAEPQTAGGPKTAAERMRDYRARRRGASDEPGDAGVTKPRNEVTSPRGEGVGGGVSADLAAEADLDPSNPSRSSGVQGGALRHEVTTDRNASPTAADFGAPTDCWLEAMRASTGGAGWTRQAQAIGAIRVLDGILGSCAPAEGDRLEWARTQAREYVEHCAGGAMSIFGFQTWLQSGKPARRTPAGRPTPSNGDGRVRQPAFEMTPTDQRRLDEAKRKASGTR